MLSQVFLLYSVELPAGTLTLSLSPSDKDDGILYKQGVMEINNTAGVPSDQYGIVWRVTGENEEFFIPQVCQHVTAVCYQGVAYCRCTWVCIATYRNLNHLVHHKLLILGTCSHSSCTCFPSLVVNYRVLLSP